VTENAADDLFALPLDGFLAAREALAKELRAAGRAEEAAAVKATRKPTVAAWAVNQLARGNRAGIAELLEAGAAVREAQQGAVSSGGRDGLRRAAATRRSVVDRLIREAGSLLERAGHPPTRTVLDRVGDSLMATATDADAAEHVGRGDVTKEFPAAAGFGGLLEGAPDHPVGPKHRRGGGRPNTRTTATGRTRQRRQEADEAVAEAERLQGEAGRLERDAKEARARAKEAERQAGQARKAADSASTRADRLRERADRSV
jgi:hypothetical protein